jgi:hypothetical protein
MMDQITAIEIAEQSMLEAVGLVRGRIELELHAAIYA